MLSPLPVLEVVEADIPFLAYIFRFAALQSLDFVEVLWERHCLYSWRNRVQTHGAVSSVSEGGQPIRVRHTALGFLVPLRLYMISLRAFILVGMDVVLFQLEYPVHSSYYSNWNIGLVPQLVESHWGCNHDGENATTTGRTARDAGMAREEWENRSGLEARDGNCMSDEGR